MRVLRAGMETERKIKSQIYTKSKLWRLLWVQRRCCSQCGKKILRFKHIKTCREIVKISSGIVEWVTPYGGICKASVATFDHTVPLSRGGDNQWQNLTAMCFQCNNAKGEKETTRPKWKRDVCRTCGGKIWELRRRNCTACRAKKKVAKFS